MRFDSFNRRDDYIHHTRFGISSVVVIVDGIVGVVVVVQCTVQSHSLIPVIF